jgi:hypothetical protein
VEVAVLAAHAETSRAESIQVLAPGDERDVLAVHGEPAAKISAHPASAEHGDLHGEIAVRPNGPIATPLALSLWLDRLTMSLIPSLSRDKLDPWQPRSP